MPSELDPLLPWNEPSPEISGDGYRHSKPQSSEILAVDEEEAENEPGSSSENVAAVSPLNSIIGIFTIVVAFAFFIAILVPGGLGIQWPQPAPEQPHRPPHSIEERVDRILEETPLIDGHNDLAIFLRFMYQNHIHETTFQERFENGGMESHVDLPRLKKGKVGGAFWSAFVPCPPNSTDFSDANYAKATSQTLSQIDLLNRLQNLYPKTFSPSTLSPSAALTSFKANHTLISPLSIEGLHQLPQSAPLSTLRLYHTLGVRAATLTWNCHNAFADAALITSPSSDHPIPAPPYRPGGLTPLGRRIITEMNRLGMLIDLSHTSHHTQLSVLSNSISLAPVIYSHSSAFALCPHPRNVHDSALHLVKRTNSIVMVNFSPDFVSCLPPADPAVELPTRYEKNNTLHQVARHIAYIGDLIGYAHVGLGSDFDGMFGTPRGLEGVDKFPDLVAELLRMGVGEEDVKGVVGANLLRVWRDAEDVGRKMREVDGVAEGEDEVER